MIHPNTSDFSDAIHRDHVLDRRAEREAPPSWQSLQPLPARLLDLSPNVRDVLGRAIDAGLARLVLDDDGSAVVARAGRP
jgi:hypothetical protein